tara:strand:+ start:868 stop:4875 length:4008 start_codon:yes stop_codon:yes gene_type:complete
MPKEIWKIDEFEGGINDYTDPKDIKNSEFAELQDCSIAKIGQVKNMGKAIPSDALGSVDVIKGVDINGDGSNDVNGGLIPGKGFYKSPNDYDIGARNNILRTSLTLEHTTNGEDAKKAHCTFEIQTLLLLIRSLDNNANFDLTFRLQAISVADGTTSIPSGTSGFDVNGSWEVLSDYGQGSLASEWDNTTHTVNNHSYTADGLVNKAWNISPIIQEALGINNVVLLGSRYNQALGFFQYRGVPGYDEIMGTYLMPYLEQQSGNYTFTNLQYQLMRDSFCQKLVEKINAHTSVPNITATYGGYGSGRIKLTAATAGTTMNGYRVYGTIGVAQSSGMTVDVTNEILTSNRSINSNRGNGGYFITSGNTTFRGGAGPTTEQWKLKVEGPDLNNDLVYVSIYMNDGDSPQGVITEGGVPFRFVSTHVALATAIRDEANAISGITATIDTTSSDFTYVIFTADAAGLNAGFQVEVLVQPRDSFFNSHAANEMHVLWSLGSNDMGLISADNHGRDIYGDTLIHPSTGLYNNLASVTYTGLPRNLFGTTFNIFAETTTSWSKYDGLGVYHPTANFAGAYKNQFDWIWAPEHDLLPEPSFYNNGNTLTMSDGNFDLPNYNFIFGYYDRSRQFQVYHPSDPYFADTSYPYYEREPAWINLKKWIKWPEKKQWAFTEKHIFGSKLPVDCWSGNPMEQERWGVRVRADENARWWWYNAFDDDYEWMDSLGAWANFVLVAEDASEQEADSGHVDWGGVEPDPENEDDTIYSSSNIRFYLAAIYDDGSETLPTHKFTFGTSIEGEPELGNYDLKFNWNQYLKFFLIVRPMTSAMRTVSEGMLEGYNDPLIMNQMLCPDPRVTGFRMYYTDDLENHDIYWSLAEINFERGVLFEGYDRHVPWWAHGQDEWGGESDWTLYSPHENYGEDFVDPFDGHWGHIYKKPKARTYEMINGFDPLDLEDTSLRYKHSVQAGNRVFVGNIEVDTTGNRGVAGKKTRLNDRMVMSQAGKLSTFPYPTNVFDLNLSDGDEITALATIASKVLQFKRGILYIVDISSNVPADFFISETLKHKGIANSNHFCDTTEGVFFFNEYGAWIYDGEEMQNVFMNLDDEDKQQQRIDPATWKEFVSDDAQCGFNPLSGEVIIVRSNNQTTNDTDGDCYVYHIYAKAWAFGRKKFHVGHSLGLREITNFSHVGADLNLGYMGNSFDTTDSVAKISLWDMTGQETDDFQIVTKSTDLGDSRSYKSILGVVVNAVETKTDSSYSLQIEWREGPGYDWDTLTDISNSDVNRTNEALTHSHIFKPPSVKGIKSIQLRIKGSIQGDFGINDIGLIFRKYKNDDLAIFDGGGD